MARILIEARTLALGGGPAVYAEQLLRALVKLESPHRFSVLVPAAGLVHFLYGTKVGIIEAGWRGRAWQPVWDEFVVGRAARRAGADLLHTTKNAAPPRWGGPTVTTLHDVCPLVCPELSAPVERWYWSRQMRRVGARAAGVITVSETEKQRLTDVLGLPPETITVTRLGVDPAFSAGLEPAALAEIRRKYKLPARFLLNVGTISLKKNIPNLLAALGQLRAARSDVPPLVIAGRPGPGMPASWPNWVTVLPYVHHAELPGLYRLAEAFLFPSRFESFGLPVIEAMASGTPVVTSTDHALPETAGGAALLAAPDDLAGLAAAVARLLDEPELRARLIAAGRDRARQFDWTATARQTLAVYEAVLETSNSGDYSHS